MEINRRALYNSLRMNWVLDPTLKVESWQVEDYRSQPIDALFEGLEDKGLHLDKSSFKAFAETVDTPEDLTDALLADSGADIKTQDKVYLLVFELWRRLLPEKPSLSLFCDEIDYQIHLFDRGQVQKAEAIEDALANLQMILDENVDNGADSDEVFECIESGCANDVESFLHDFIGDQIDNKNDSYAIELIDGFGNYARDVRWFDFLRARLHSNTGDVEEADHMIKLLIEDKTENPDLELNLEMLSYLVSNGDKKTFERLAKDTVDFLQVEEDFQVLISICAEFYLRMDMESAEKALQEILKNRENLDIEKAFNHRDPQIAEFLKIISK